MSKFYEELRESYAKLDAEFIVLQEWAEKRGCPEQARVDFGRSECWFSVETYDLSGRIYSHYFSCPDAKLLKDAVRHILNNTIFYSTVVYIRGYSYVTFSSPQLFDREWNHYYSGV